MYSLLNSSVIPFSQVGLDIKRMSFGSTNMVSEESTERRHLPPHLAKLYNIITTTSLFSFITGLVLNPSGIPKAVVLQKVKEAILEGKHFDERNPCIILCDRSQQLENIFGMKALHVCQVQTALAKSMVDHDAHENSSDSDYESGTEQETGETPATDSKAPVANPHTKFKLSEKLRQLFVSAALVTDQELFTFTDAAGLLSSYIISRKDHIFDSRNIMVALVGQDPLGNVFNVTAFHRSQASMFLKRHLIPVLQEPIYTKQTSSVETQTEMEIKNKEKVKIEPTNAQMPQIEIRTRKRCTSEAGVHPMKTRKMVF